MKIDSRYSKSFYSDRLSKTKLKSITDLAMSIQNVKNEISLKVNADLLKYLEMSKFDFQKEVCSIYKYQIPSNFIKQVADDVFTAYENKFKGIQKKLRFEKITDFEINLYKRATKKNKKGDFKSVSKKKKVDNLTVTLTYLARYGNENTEFYLKEKSKNEIDFDKKNFYDSILGQIEKFGFNRLMALAQSKRQKVLKRYSEFPICFSKLTFRGRSRLSSEIVSYNENFNSVLKAFVNISWLSRGEQLSIPIKYSKDFHGDMKKYTNGTDTSYTICFEENGQIRIILSYRGEREIPENKSNYVGIDVNVKHNLFQCSNGDTIDFDRRLVETLSKELVKIDKIKKENPDYNLGKRKIHKINHLQRELDSKIRFEISNLCKKFNSSGLDHAIFEDLDNSFGKCFVKDENDFNFNRKVKMLKLSSLKDEFEHIARKYDICTSTVHSFYTSQQCPQCGHIDSENRKNQEEFECIECGYAANADINASLNIKQRLVSTVLRNELLKKNKLGNGTFSPKILEKEKVKEVLLSKFRNHSEMNKEYTVSTA